MESVPIDGGAVTAQSVGSGEPVLLIHGAIIADTYACLEGRSGLGDSLRLITYHRRGFAGSSTPSVGLSIAQQAADAMAVLDHYGIDRAHVVGHSYGGCIALQLAMDAPDRVASLSLLEPGIFAVPAAEEFMQGAQAIAEVWAGGDKAGATDMFLQAIGGPDYRAAADETVPAGWFDGAVAAIDTWFQTEVPSLGEWPFGPEQAASISQPCLAVCGDESAEVFQQGFDWQQQHFHDVRAVRVPSATHLLQMQNPAAVATAIADFVAQHPLSS